MKKFLFYTVLLVTVSQLSCTKKFDEINTDPNQTTASLFDPNYLLSEAQWEYSNTGYNQLLFESMWSQVLASTYNYYGNGDKYVYSGSFTNYRNGLWDADYRAASLANEILNLVNGKPELVNLASVATLMKVIIMQRVTDVYGDVPYSQAFKAKEGLTQPVYDKQQDIYNSMLNEVQTAVTNLDPSKAKPTNDLFYGGDIAKWKRFGYSLMLRLAMRLTKVDPGTAQTWAEKAAAGGTFTSIDDNAKVKADNANGFGNGTTSALRTADDYREARWSETFIDYLKATNDPRISAIAEVSQPGYANNTNQDLAGDNNPAIQIGLPNGYTIGGINNITQYAKYPGPSGSGTDVAPVGKYSRPRTVVYLDRSGINMVFTYAQTEFLLAEAKVRGWNVGATSAAQHFANGLTAAMKSLAQFNSAATISDATINAYVAAHPLDMSTPANAIKMINEQYWVETGTMFMFIENWINWRRSGYPVLTPVNFPGNFSNGTIPRRIPYETGEGGTNPQNYLDAVSRLNNGDEFTSRVWWDKP